MATYSDFVLDDYKRPILGAKVKAYASDGTTLLDATVTDALGAFTVTADDQQAILLVEYGGWSERSSIIIGVPPEIVGPPGPQGADNRTLAWSESFAGTQGQTTFVTSRDFYPGAVNVLLNGLDLLPSDFTTSGVRTIMLAMGLAAAGNIIVRAFALIDGDDTGGGGGGIPDVPTGTTTPQSRTSAGWVASPSGSGGIADVPPNTTTPQSRTSTGWVASPSGGGGVADVAPNTTQGQARTSAGWTPVTAAATLISTQLSGMSGAQSRALDQHIRERVHAFDVIPASMHTAIKNRSAYTDDIAQFLQPAFNSTIGTNGGLTEFYFPGGAYNIGAGLDTKSHSIVGDGLQSTFLNSLSGMTGNAMLTMRGQSHIESLWIEAQYAREGIRVENCGSARLDQLFVQNAYLAGIAFSDVGNNSNGLITSSVSRNNGRKFACGTGTTNSARDALTISGAAPNSPSLGLGGGIRPRYDFVKVAGYALREIFAVSANTINVYPPFPAALSNVAVTIVQGSGLEIRRNGDNSCIASHKSTYQNNAFAGIDCSSLYGAQSVGDVCEYNSHAIAVGRRVAGGGTDGGEMQVINMSVRDIYSEANGENAVVYHGSSRQFSFVSPVVDGYDPLEAIYIADRNTLRDFRFEAAGIVSEGKHSLMGGGGTNAAVYGQIYTFSAASGTGNPTMQLPTPGATGNTRPLLRELFIPIRFRTLAMNGQSLRFTATDYINGTAPTNGTSTWAMSGDYKNAEAYFEPTYGWTITGTGTLSQVT